MSLRLSILPKVSSDAKTLIFTETTGIYSVTNTTGWGNPNPLISSCETVGAIPGALLTVLTPDDTTITIFSYNPSGGGTQFPETTGLQEDYLYYYTGTGYTATYSSTATPENMPDGVYTFTYSVYSKDAVSKISTLYSTTYYLLVTTAIGCCVDKLFHLASQADCTDCKNEKLNKALEAESYLKAAEYANACGKNNMAAKHLAKAQWICSEQNCLNC